MISVTTLKTALIALVAVSWLTSMPTPSLAYEKYDNAKFIFMLGYHWEPVSIPRNGPFSKCGNSGERFLCERYPELVSCSGSNEDNPNTCRMVFSTPDGKFAVVTTYGWANPDLMVVIRYGMANEEDTANIKQYLSSNKAPENTNSSPSQNYVHNSVRFTTAPSFNCAKARASVEKAICANPLLSRMDSALSQNYKDMLDANIGEGAKDELRAMQRRWITERNLCTTDDCIELLYRTRIDAVCEYPVIYGIHPDCIVANTLK